MLNYRFVFFCVQLSANFLHIAFFKKGCKIFPNFSVLSLTSEKALCLGLLNHYTNRGFSQFKGFFLLRKKKNRPKQ